MIKENKVSKYLLYAIGEIVLVVIGILIALSINNWNQERQFKKVERSTLESLVSEFESNKISIQICQNSIIKKRLFGDSIRMQLGQKLPTLTIDKANQWFGEIGDIDKCTISVDILKDIQGSGKLNLISNEEIRINISKWSSYLKHLERDEDDWAQEFSSEFVPYVNKWIQWDDVDYLFHKKDPRYYKSRFPIDPRLILQKPEFSNIMAMHYWRMAKIETRIELILKQTDKVLELIQNELNKK